MTRLDWSTDRTFTLDGVAYRTVGFEGDAPGPDEMSIIKSRASIERYESLVEVEQPRNILELGIYAGGSAALLAQLARPRRLAAVDIRSVCPPLDRFVAEHELGEAVRPHYRVDQANTDQLDVVMEDFDGPLDLVIDDASHLDAQTRASFNHLFPSLRPGGVYVIEDWAWAHQSVLPLEAAYQGVTPLSAFVCELVLVAAARPRLITDVVIDNDWAIVRRGPADIHPGAFDLASRTDDVGRAMIDGLSGALSRRESA